MKTKEDNRHSALLYHYLDLKKMGLTTGSAIFKKNTKRAKDLLLLFDYDVDKARAYISKIHEWARANNTGYSLETVVEKYREVKGETPFEDVFVNTPSGKRFHGRIIGKDFNRLFDFEKDVMHIFDALSIHPDVLESLGAKKVNTLVYEEKNTHTKYSISIKDALEKGWEKSFAGGKTFYIPLKFWEQESQEQPKLI